jgi:hypothetical protein
MVAVPTRRPSRVLRTAWLAPQPNPVAAIEIVRRQYATRLRLSGVDQELAEIIAGDLVAGIYGRTAAP